MFNDFLDFPPRWYTPQEWAPVPYVDIVVVLVTKNFNRRWICRVYWGETSYSQLSGDQNLHEEVLRKRYEYNEMVIRFLSSFFTVTFWFPKWVFPKIRVPPKWMVCNVMEIPIQMDDLGVPVFSETLKWRSPTSPEKVVTAMGPNLIVSTPLFYAAPRYPDFASMPKMAHHPPRDAWVGSKIGHWIGGPKNHVISVELWGSL